MEPTSKKRGFDHDAAKKYDDFFDVKPTLKKTKTAPPPKAQPSKDDQKANKAAPWHKNQQFLTKFIGLKKQYSIGTGVINTDSLLVCSWNINGLRAVTTKNDIQKYFTQRKPDILCLSETKATQDSIDAEGLATWVPPEYTCYWNCSKVKKGYSGTGVITKYKPMSVEFGMGVEKFDIEGRVINLEFEKFYLVACYVPMSGDDFSKLPMRANEWDPAFRAHLLKLKAKKPVIVCGDLNVIHKNMDLWGESGKWAGSSEEEKTNFTKLLNDGFVDTFRYKYPNTIKYSWWSTYFNQRPSNKGRRYDYILVSKELQPGVIDAFIDNDILGSDHCPVELLVNLNCQQEEKKDDSDLEEIKEVKPEKEVDKVIVVQKSIELKTNAEKNTAPPILVGQQNANVQKEPEVIHID